MWLEGGCTSAWILTSVTSRAGNHDVGTNDDAVSQLCEELQRFVLGVLSAVAVVVVGQGEGGAWLLRRGGREAL